METGTRGDFSPAFALLEEAFPPEELRVKKGQYALLKKSPYRLLLEKDDGRLTALLAVWEFSDFRYIEHAAVQGEQRGRGIGTRMIAEYLAQSDLPVVLEAELPETQQAIRRIAFYERLGFLRADFAYEQPPLRAGSPAVPLCILSWPERLSEARFAPWKEVLLRVVYAKGSGKGGALR